VTRIDAALHDAASPPARYGVALVAWPSEEPIRRALATRRIPRLLLVAAGCPPPVVIDDLEDWLREPIDAADAEARAGALAQRAQLEVSALASPRPDEPGAADDEADEETDEAAVGRTDAWIVDDADIERLVAATQRTEEPPRSEPPTIDADSGVVRVAGRWVVVPETQMPVAAVLVRSFGTLVSRDDIVRAYVRGSGSSDPAAVKSMTLRLGRRLAEIGLVLRTVRGQGLVLEHPAGA
jgi:DNA-binding response OmpR family regulator